MSFIERSIPNGDRDVPDSLEGLREHAEKVANLVHELTPIVKAFDAAENDANAILAYQLIMSKLDAAMATFGHKDMRAFKLALQNALKTRKS
jgi:hypothetical protein